MLNDVQKCAKTANISYSTLSTCYNGPESNKLQAAAATATPADHKYVPWIVINGRNCLNGCDGFVKKVCKQAKASGVKNLPGICTKTMDQEIPIVPCNVTTM